MEELQRERREPEYRTARTGTVTIGASDPRAVEEMKARIMEQTGSGWRSASASNLTMAAF
jgi:hypothetical protein